METGYTEAFGTGFVAGMVFGMSVLRRAWDMAKEKRADRGED